MNVQHVQKKVPTILKGIVLMDVVCLLLELILTNV